jgi:hypothetical protein
LLIARRPGAQYTRSEISYNKELKMIKGFWRSVVLILTVFLQLSCTTNKPKQEFTSQIEKNGITIGIASVEFSDKNMDIDLQSKIENIQITYLDWYINKEITIKVDTNGFYYFPVERNSIFWLRRIEILFHNDLNMKSMIVNLVSFDSKYALHAPSYMDSVNNNGILHFIIKENNDFEIKHSYGYDEVLSIAYTINEMMKYNGYKYNKARLSNG